MKKLLICFCLAIVFMLYFGFNYYFYSQKDGITTSGVYVKEMAKTSAQETDFGFIKQATFCGAENAKKYFNKGNVVGEFLEANPQTFNLDLFAQKMGLVVLSKTNLESSQNIYCYCALSPYKIKDKDFNMQISISKTKIIVATPIIFGSF